MTTTTDAESYVIWGGETPTPRALAALVIIVVTSGEITPEEAAKKLAESMLSSWGAFQNFIRIMDKNLEVFQKRPDWDEISDTNVTKLITHLKQVKGRELTWPMPIIPQGMRYDPNPNAPMLQYPM